MLKDKTISMIGTGNMGEALVSGLILSKSTAAENIICTDVREDQLESVKEKYGVNVTTNNLDAVKASEIIIYESCLKKKLRLIRVMPNIAAFVKESATVVAAGENASQDDVKMAMAIFDSMGKTIFLKENVLMDAITGLSGSGPAYIFLIVDALADAGVKVGLARQDALFLATQTVLGAAKLLLETKEHPGRLKDMVTSPGGTAIAGIHTLEKGGLRTTLIDAVEAATKRSQELGEIITKNFSNKS